MKEKLKRIWKPAAIVIPFVLGMIGFGIAGEPVLQAIYKCICLYGMGHSDAPANLLIELARWLAPLATAGSVVLVVKTLRRHAGGILARWTGKSVAVYGPEEEKAALLKELGIRGIDMNKRPMKAHRYILLGGETENLDFFRNHLAKEGKEVYLKCQALPALASDRANLHLFCPEETAARLFWQEHCLYRQSVECGHRMSVVLLGFGKLGRELLLSGLQNNIFDANQHVEYHVFGEEEGFLQVYHECGQISDPIVFHAESWKEAAELLQQAGMVIVARQEGQLALLRELTLMLPGKQIHVLGAQPDGLALMAGQAPLVCFDWKKEAMKPANILSDRLYRYAKRINLRYAHLYGGVEENDETCDLEWNRLDTFTRYSNLSAADYHAIQLQMLDGEECTPEKLEWLAELEHIRWNRYHYLNNWVCGMPENGKNKDMVKRIHQSLRPYAELSESEREKDRENIRILLQLDQE